MFESYYPKFLVIDLAGFVREILMIWSRSIWELPLFDFCKDLDDDFLFFDGELLPLWYVYLKPCVH